ncbi:uncharacterized protein J4E92_004001 [Alternaria infectoria]|uniref:uncharacterized protein n=1 Tax=Alternaria infectoria TaxID=45303 RepID=UPI00221F9B7A|nr:uncharacterized protein J4E92_004001 [Alternaria infectoria]KAI4932102.1 hypothetical protein J4E92_004001 [Alternaria infectoria]
MDLEQDIDNLGKTAATMKIGETEAEKWKRAASKPDTRFLHYTSKHTDRNFPPSFYQSGDYNTRPENRPRTADAMRAKRKRTDNDGKSALKRTKEQNTTTDDVKVNAVKLLYTTYIMKGGVDRAGVVLDETEFTEKLPAQFWQSETPGVWTLEDVTPYIAATEPPHTPNQTVEQAPIELEKPPEKTEEFLKWAKKEITEYSKPDSLRFRLALSWMKSPDFRKKGFRTALEVLQAHLGRVATAASNAEAVNIHIQESRESLGSLMKSSEQLARQLGQRRDELTERVKAFGKEVEAVG